MRHLLLSWHDRENRDQRRCSGEWACALCVLSRTPVADTVAHNSFFFRLQLFQIHTVTVKPMQVVWSHKYSLTPPASTPTCTDDAVCTRWSLGKGLFHISHCVWINSTEHSPFSLRFLSLIQVFLWMLPTVNKRNKILLNTHKRTHPTPWEWINQCRQPC